MSFSSNRVKNLPSISREVTQSSRLLVKARLVLDLPTPEVKVAELTLVVGYISRWFTCPQTVTHPSSNQLIAT